MTNLKRLTFTLALILSASLLCRAQEQPTPSVEVSAASDRTQFSARGEIQQMRVEVFAPSGEKVFDSGAVFSPSVTWDMRGKGGRRVADGVYLASVSTVSVAGKVTKRAEQVMVGAVQTTGTEQAPVPPSLDAPVTSANGTAGKIAKFTTASNIENSVMTENSSKIGINVAPPTAILHVNGLQPAPVATNGTTAAMLLQTSGGTSLMTLNASGHLNVKGVVSATAFVETSDRNAKTNFSTINPRSILDRLAAIPVQTWNYKGEAEAVRHRGPMAQDFRAAFNLGSDDKTIWAIDSAGVTMAAVQGLYQLSQEKDKQIEQLTNEAKTLRSELDDLRARMLQLEEAIKRQQK